jgi:hypothetical protein
VKIKFVQKHRSKTGRDLLCLSTSPPILPANLATHDSAVSELGQDGRASQPGSGRRRVIAHCLERWMRGRMWRCRALQLVFGWAQWRRGRVKEENDWAGVRRGRALGAGSGQGGRGKVWQYEPGPAREGEYELLSLSRLPSSLRARSAVQYSVGTGGRFFRICHQGYSHKSDVLRYP